MVCISFQQLYQKNLLCSKLTLLAASVILLLTRKFCYSCRISEIVSDADLKFLIEKLDQKLNESEKWEQVIDKRNNLLSYNAKCCKPKVTAQSMLKISHYNFLSCSLDC